MSETSDNRNFSGALSTWKGKSYPELSSGVLQQEYRRHRPHDATKAVGYVCDSRGVRHEARLNISSDAQGLELVENQKESLVGRKALADRTKGA